MKYGQQVVDDETVTSAAAFILLYIASFVVGAMVLAFSGQAP